MEVFKKILDIWDDFIMFFTPLSTNQLATGWCNHAHLEPLVQGSSPRAVKCAYVNVDCFMLDLLCPTSEKQEHKISFKNLI